MNEETLRKFVAEQWEMCRTALEAIAERGDTHGLKDWFEGRRDMCVIILQKMVN